MEQGGVPAVIACTTADDKKVELRLEPTGLVLSGAVKAELPFQYIATYECSRVKDVGPQWELRIAFVSWRMHLFGKTVTNHVLRLTVPEVSECCVVPLLFPRLTRRAQSFHSSEADPNMAFAQRLVVAIDKAALQWMRQTSGVAGKNQAVSSVSLLRPQSGVEAALMTIKRESESDDLGLEVVGVELSSKGSGGGGFSRGLPLPPTGETRHNPGNIVFCDEEAIARPGFVVEGQQFIYGVRCLGSWSVWKQGFVSVVVNQELIPAMLILAPGAMVLMLPTANLFAPFPLQDIAGWGASNDSFSFRHVPAKGIFNVITFSSYVAAEIESMLIHTTNKMVKGQLPSNPFPPFY
jgi:hypothetical protein